MTTSVQSADINLNASNLVFHLNHVLDAGDVEEQRIACYHLLRSTTMLADSLKEEWERRAMDKVTVDSNEFGAWLREQASQLTTGEAFRILDQNQGKMRGLVIEEPEDAETVWTAYLTLNGFTILDEFELVADRFEDVIKKVAVILINTDTSE